MPGPKAGSRTKGRKPAPNTPTRKIKAKLERRIEGWTAAGGDSAKDGSGRAMKMHKPGSQNRHKS